MKTYALISLVLMSSASAFVGGTKAPANTFTFHISYPIGCSATLISPTKLLTSASCVDSKMKLYQTTGVDSKALGAKPLGIKRVLYHKGHNFPGKTRNLGAQYFTENALALIELYKPVSITPAKLPGQGHCRNALKTLQRKGASVRNTSPLTKTGLKTAYRLLKRVAQPNPTAISQAVSGAIAYHEKKKDLYGPDIF